MDMDMGKGMGMHMRMLHVHVHAHVACACTCACCMCMSHGHAWIASSRVGAMASARMATTVLRPPPWLPPPGPASSSLYMIGSIKASVLPG